MSEREIDNDIFHAVSNSFLVIDGRIVTDNGFRTCDPAIFAAGSAAKFSLKYYTDRVTDNYSSREQGISLAQAVLSILDPLSSAAAVAPEGSVPILAPFVAPKVDLALLPGNHTVLHAYHPRLGTPCSTPLGSRFHTQSSFLLCYSVLTILYDPFTNCGTPCSTTWYSVLNFLGNPC